MAVSILASSLMFLLFQNTGSIQGAVLSTATDKGVPGAQISVIKTPDRPPATAGGLAVGVTGGILTLSEGPGSERLTAVTDGNGRFFLQSLAAGTYIVSASADGYSRQQFGPPPGGQTGMSTSVQLAAGQAAKDVVLHLVPAGTVTGRVTGGNGEPLVGMDVQLVRVNYQYTGERMLLQLGSAQTDDRGIYRLFWMPPGQYYVSVNSSARPIPGVVGLPSATNNKYPRTFYPGTTELARAAQIDLGPGEELSGIDMRLAPSQTYTVRGRVVDTVSGQIPQRASLTVIRREQNVGGPVFAGQNMQYHPNDGTFELKDVLPGSYLVRAQMPFQPPQSGTTGRIQTPATGVAPVEVTGSDVDGVVVSIQPPAMIAGRVRIDGPTAATGSQLRVALQPDPRGNLNSGLPSPALVQPDGSFQLENVAPGDYQVSVPTGTPAGATGLNSSAAFYVKEARFGSTDILTEPLVIAGPTTTELQLVLGTNAGQITGTVTDDSQQAASRVQMILLVPDRRERRDLYKTGGTDPNGRFTIRSVAPGSYTAYAVDPNNFALIFDPVLNAKAQPKGQHITVGESSNLTVDLVVVAPPK